ncbi:putative head protein [Edwardsiella phage MSW-3]|uniref:Putative head protein n=1 Tax=Edwardsiella phage MSW-3 TaxID=1264700 RepID=L0MX79_9CAUD|nr:head maturation protease [Edwardsiella phage MSW-3]BAM68834.1 putative head protein [Edwardsiella phage MSW-3]
MTDPSSAKFDSLARPAYYSDNVTEPMIIMHITINDRATFPITRREYTDEGFLRVPGHVARTGIQEYLASELGLNDRNPNDIIRVYRPSDEVFNSKSLLSYDGVDITLEHPNGLVNADNFRKTTVGVVRGKGRQYGEFVECDLIVKDKAAIQSVQSGKCELSAGYTASYDYEPGETPEGEPYDYIQRDIKINHVAIVGRARAGRNARILDHKPEGTRMPVMITTDSGRSVDVADPNNAQVVADAFDRAVAAKDSADARADGVQSQLDAANEKIAKLEQQTSDAAISERVKAISTALTAATRIAGKDFTCDSVDIVEIQRSALQKKFPKRDWATKSTAYVQAAFDAAYEEEEEEPDDKDNKMTGDSAASLRQFGSDLSNLGARPATDAAPVLSRAQAYVMRTSGKKESK